MENQLTPRPLQGEILGRADTVRVCGYLDPMKQRRIDCEYPAGETIAELLERATAGERRPGFAHALIAQVNGGAIPPEWWGRIRPRPGALVTFFCRLQGDATRSILALAVTVAAIVFAPYLAGLPILAGLTGLIGSQAVIGIIGAGIAMGGMLALNQLYPIVPPQLREPESVKSVAGIQGGSNAINRYGAVPIILGRHRFYPPMAVMPYTEIYGDDQYLRGAVVWGIGRHTRADYKIGETPLEEFEDAEFEHTAGGPGDAPLSLIVRDIHEEQLSIVLEAGEPSIRLTQPNTFFISVDITAPEGIYRVNKDTGAYRQREVSVDFAYRLAGSSDPWVDFGTITFRREMTTARKARHVNVPAGEYEVRASAHGTGSDEVNVKSMLVWTALRSATGKHAIRFPKPLALTAFRIRASDQLNGVIDQLNATVNSLALAYDGAGNWVANQPTSNPADLFRFVLQNDAQLRPKPDSEIDIETLEDWWVYCNANRFKYNAVRDTFAGTWNLLCEIAAAGRAFPIHRDGKWSVAWDRPNDVIRQHFTPKNAWGFASEKSFAEETHAWRIPFIDEDKDFAESEMTVYADGYNESNATKFEQIEFPGVTNRDLIWRHGRFHIAQIELRPQTTSFTTDLEGLIAQRGDRVNFASEIDLIGQFSGYVRGAGIDAGNDYIDLDEIAVLQPGQDYAIGFTKNNGVYVVRSVVVPPGGAETRRLTLAGNDELPIGGELYSFGLAGFETVVMRIKEIVYQDELRARVTVVDDAPEISQADEGEIPDYDPDITPPVDPSSLPPRDLRVTEWLESFGKTLRLMARVSWQVPRLAFIRQFEVQKRDEDAAGDWKRAAIVGGPKTEAEFPLDSEGVWSFRVRAIFADGRFSTWATLPNIEMLGILDPPDDIKNLHRTYISGNSTLDWDEIRDARAVRYEVRRGETLASALTIADKLAQPRFATVGDGTYWIAGYVLRPDGERIYSVNWASVLLQDSVLTKNIIVTHDEAALGFPGDKEGCEVVAGVLRATGAPITAGWALEILNDINALDGYRTFVYRAPVGHIVDVKRLESCPLNMIWEGVGAAVGEDFLSHADLLAVADILGQAAARQVRVFPVMRVSRSTEFTTYDIFAPSDVFAEADIFPEEGPAWEPWQPFSPGAMKGRIFQAGLVGYSLDPEINPACPAFSWAVDVPDRIDNYNNLTIPAATATSGGLALTFRPDATPSVPAPFNGGPAGQALPTIGGHVIGAITEDLIIEITNLTLAGCTVKIATGSPPSYIAKSNVSIQAFGY